MGLLTVIKHTGQGSWFGHGRIFGVHNPLGSIAGKAGDPFINLRTLARLSFNNDPEIVRAVSANIAQKLLQKMPARDLVYVLKSFNKKVILPLSSEQLDELSLSTHSGVLEKVSRHQKATPAAIARAISGFIPRTKETLGEILSLSGDILVNNFYVSRREYNEDDVAAAIEVLKIHDPQKQEQILVELAEINEELAELIRAKIKAN